MSSDPGPAPRICSIPTLSPGAIERLTGLCRGGELTKQLLDTAYLAATVRCVTGQFVDGGKERFAPNHLEQAGDAGVIEAFAPTHQQVMLGGQWQEIQTELVGGSFDTEANIGHAGGDVGRDRRVGVLLKLEAGGPWCSKSCIAQQNIEQGPGSGAPLAIDETYVIAQQVGQTVDTMRVARRYHQPLTPGDKANDRMPAGAELAPIVFQQRAPCGGCRHVVAGDIAGAAVESRQGLLGTAVLQVELEASGKLGQQGDRIAMAGVHA